MALKPSKFGFLPWVDIETNHFDETKGRMLEISIIITDFSGRYTLSQFNQCIDFPKGEEETWNEWCRNTHTKNGLIEACHTVGVSLEKAEDNAIDFMKKALSWHIYADDENATKPYLPPMCGSGVGFDKQWLRVHMPRLLRMFSYRVIDVSVLYELTARSNALEVDTESNMPDYPHRATGDLERSIELLSRYKQAFGL